MNKTQKGFAVLEGLLLLVVVGMIAGSGWYAFHSKHQTDKILSQSEKTSQSTPAASKNTVITQKYLTIKEWGVKGPYQSDVDLSYKITSDDIGEVWAQMSSTQLKAAAPECDEQSQMGGVIIRYHKGDDLRGPAGQDTGQTIEQAIKSNVLTEYSHVGDYYYYFEHPQAACGVSQKSVDIQGSTLSAVKEAAQNFQALN
jgi:hypothetical protein